MKGKTVPKEIKDEILAKVRAGEKIEEVCTTSPQKNQMTKLIN